MNYDIGFMGWTGNFVLFNINLCKTHPHDHTQYTNKWCPSVTFSQSFENAVIGTLTQSQGSNQHIPTLM